MESEGSYKGEEKMSRTLEKLYDIHIDKTAL